MTSHPGIVVAAVTWNLFHGRDHPPDPALLTWRSRLFRVTERGATHAQMNRPLLTEFGSVLDGLDWEIALLQEAPPRWLAPLSERCRAQGVLGLTSRNQLAPVRAAIARRNPDLIASNEGGSNMVLVRSPAQIATVERHELAARPERRALLLARVAAPGGGRVAVACMHLSVPSTGLGGAEAVRAGELADAFAGSDPLIFGGDLNLRPAEHPEPFAELERRFALAAPTAPRAIDHLLTRRLEVVERPRALPAEAREVEGPGGLRVRLSDHAPVACAFGMR